MVSAPCSTAACARAVRATASASRVRSRSASRVGMNAFARRPRHRMGTSTPAGSTSRLSYAWALKCTLLASDAHLGDEAGQVLQRVVKVVLPERRELEVLAHLGRDR